MNFKVIPSDKFEKEARHLIKKYPSLKKELSEIGLLLATSPMTDTPLGNNTL